MDGGFSVEKETHFLRCRPCGQFGAMYEAYRTHFKIKDEEVARDVANPPPGLEHFVEFVRSARNAMGIYDSFDAYRAQHTARQATILPFQPTSRR